MSEPATPLTFDIGISGREYLYRITCELEKRDQLEEEILSNYRRVLAIGHENENTIQTLKNENTALKTENETLRTENTSMKNEHNAALLETLQKLTIIVGKQNGNP